MTSVHSITIGDLTAEIDLSCAIKITDRVHGYQTDPFMREAMLFQMLSMSMSANIDLSRKAGFPANRLSRINNGVGRDALHARIETVIAARDMICAQLPEGHSELISQLSSLIEVLTDEVEK